MSFVPTEEQEELRATVRRFLEDRAPMTEVRRLMDTSTGYDREVWSRMGGQLGLQGLHIPEEYGGQGFTVVELALVLEEMGRALLCAPFLASACLAASAILHGATEEQRRALLPGIASGEVVATLALAEESGRWDDGGIALQAWPDGGGFRLEGTKSFVVDGHIADRVVVAGRRPGSSGPEGVSLFLVEGDAAGLERSLLPTLDPTRRLARLRLSGVRATLLGEEGSAWPALTTVLREAAVCLAAEAAGGARRCLESAVEYAKVRIQFDRPIGSFQALKHLCADLLLDVEQATSAAYHAARAAAEGAAELPVVASIAKACCTETYTRAATESIHIHGGIGFTWEHDAHLHLRRARSSEVLFGDPAHHRELVAREMIGAAC
ncbi:MAG TPA: acyl-CoA dehydrogenase family protein [Candidatus Dormibacteraeota bacterium]|nr:acyl-CoA dehydrogenase family protein [Candidatus Dormibacteraeota bacterium]